MAVPAIPSAGQPWLTWAQGIDTEARKVVDKADATDTRLTDARTPIDGSVTNVKVASNAAISADKLADGTTGKVLTAAERTKLAGIATGATANSADATLLARGNHTGTQTSATISDLTEAVQDIVGAFFGAGTGASVTYNDAANTITVSATGTNDPEAIRDTIGAALIGVGNLSVTVNDAGDTITLSTTATVNSTDAALRDRSTHTGTQAASTITGLAAVATSGAYGDLTGKPVGPIFISAADYGWSTGATPAANDAAFAAAFAAAKAAKRPLYLGTGTYQVSAPLNTNTDASYAGGVHVFGAGINYTVIENVTNTSALVLAGGLWSSWTDFAIRHSNFSPDANTGDGFVFYKVAYCTFARLRVENTGRAFTIAQQGVPDQSDGTSNATQNWMFSCSFTDIVVFRYTKNALYFHSVVGRSTGSAFTNVYLQNAGGTASGYPVDLQDFDEAVFNQLNIEDVTAMNIGILAVSCGNIVINSLHFERANLSGWQPQYVRVFGLAGIVLNSMTVAFSDVGPAGAQDHSRLFSVAGGGQLVVHGYQLNNVTKTTSAQPFSIGEIDDVNANSALEIGYGTISSSVAFTATTRTALSNPGLKRIGDQLYALGSAVPTQTKTAAYTLTAGDAGSVIEVNSASAVTITVPANVLAAGAVVEIVQLGTGQVTIAAGTNMTLRTPASLTTRAAYSSVAIRARSGTEAVVSGDLT